MPVNEIARNEVQAGVHDQAIKNMASGLDTLIVAPTGLGKTNIISEIVKTAKDRARDGFRALVISDRVRVTEQNHERGVSLGLRDSSISTDGKMDIGGAVIYATTATLAANLHTLPTDLKLVVIDEAQHTSKAEGTMHSDIVDGIRARNPDARFVGATAFDSRHDRLSLHPVLAEAERVQVTFQTAVDIGAIVPGRTITPDHRLADGERIETVVDRHLDPERPAEALTGLQKALRDGQRDDFFDRSVAEWEKVAREHKRETGNIPGTFAYANTIADSLELQASFRAAGVRSATVNSEMTPAAIKDAFKAYREGRVDALVSVDMLNEGVDEPRTSVILLSKQTTTRSQYIQISGRAARAHSEMTDSGRRDKAHYTLIDMGASTYLHGSMTKHRQVENFVVNGPAPGRYNPWKVLEGDGKTFPLVIGMHNGQRTVFAMKASAKEKFHLYEKVEKRFGAGKTPSAHLVKNLVSRPMGQAEVVKLGHDEVKARPDVFISMESRKGDTSMEAVLKDSYRKSRDSLMVFASYINRAPRAAKKQGMSR